MVEEISKIDKLASQISIWGEEATPLACSQDKSFVKKYNTRHFVSAKSLQFSILVKVKVNNVLVINLDGYDTL